MTPKAKAKIERARKIQQIVLRFMRKHARWQRLVNGLEVLMYQDEVFLITLSIQEEVRRSCANSSTWVSSRRALLPGAVARWCRSIGRKALSIGNAVELSN
jgi:hypothetical protein